jgi:hypothetical protein
LRRLSIKTQIRHAAIAPAHRKNARPVKLSGAGFRSTVAGHAGFLAILAELRAAPTV